MEESENRRARKDEDRDTHTGTQQSKGAGERAGLTDATTYKVPVLHIINKHSVSITEQVLARQKCTFLLSAEE